MLRLEIPALEGCTREEMFYAAATRLLEALGLDVEKGVLPHISHVLPRTKGGKFAKVSDLSHLPRLSAEEAQAARERALALQQELGPRLQTHLEDWQAGHLTPGQWFDRCSADLRHYYDALYRCGKQAAGNPGIVLSPQDKAVLKRLLDDELHYLAGFREHLKDGGGKMPYPERLALYANAAWEAFWTGFTLGDLRPGREIRWRFGGTIEHCVDCQRFVEMGWTGAKEFLTQVLAQGYAPRSGMLSCTGTRCLCWLEERLLGGETSLEGEWEQQPPYIEFQKKAPGASAEGSSVERTPAFDTGSPQPVSGFGDSGSEPIPVGSGARAAVLLGVLAALAYLGSKGGKALRDAVAYLYFNAQEQGAYLHEPLVLRRLDRLRSRASVWLRGRHTLTEAQAADVLTQAEALGAFRAEGRYTHWELPQWPEPRLADYPELRERYRDAEQLTGRVDETDGERA